MINSSKQGIVEDGGSSSVSRWSKYGSVGSIIWSVDFIYGIPVGVALGAIPTFSPVASDGAVAILITFAGVLVAIAAVILAAVTLFATLMDETYRLALESTRGGIRGAVRPYLAVALVSGGGILTSLAAALGWPALPRHFSWLHWLTFSVPASLTMWAIIGSVQLVGLGNYHIERRAELLKFLADVKRRRSDSRSA